MPYQDIVIQTADNYRKAFESDPVTRIFDALGFGGKYRDASAKTMLEDPYTEIEDGFITTIGNHTSLKDCLVQNTKEMYCMVKDGVRYTLKNPVDIALLPVQTIYEMIKRPKVMAITILGIAVLGAGCISQPSDSSSPNNGADLPIATPTNEKVMKTTPDGMTFYGSPNSNDNKYLSAYDTDGDGDIDVKDSAVNQPMADQYNNGDIKKTIKGIYGIPIDSKMYQDHPEIIKEIRVRQSDLDGDGKFKEKIEILINDKIVHTTTTDTDQDGGVSLRDALLELGWL